MLRRNGFQVSNTGYFVYCNGTSATRLASGDYIRSESYTKPQLNLGLDMRP